MAKLPKYLSALPQLSWLCIFQSYPASCRGKIAAIQTQLAGYVCLNQGRFSLDGFGTILFRDKTCLWETIGRKTDVQRPSTTIHATRKRKPIETELPGADSQPGLQRVAASASDKENDELFTSAGCERSHPRLCSMLRFLFCYKALYFAPWWCKYKIQSLELLPSLPCLERKETSSHSSAHSPSVHSRFILAKEQLFPRGIERLILETNVSDSYLQMPCLNVVRVLSSFYGYRTKERHVANTWLGTCGYSKKILAMSLRCCLRVVLAFRSVEVNSLLHLLRLKLLHLILTRMLGQTHRWTMNG